jgi:thymidine phosphorylase
MDQPLGMEVGNANELKESVEVLQGAGPSDVVELTLAFGEVMLELAGVAGGRSRLEEAITTGAALQKLADVVAAQGGDPAVIEDTSLLPQAPHVEVIEADRDGFVTRCDALTIGTVATRLGAGRERKEDAVDPGVGITLEAKLGAEVHRGQPLATVRHSDPARFEAQRGALLAAWKIGDEQLRAEELVVERIDAGSI